MKTVCELDEKHTDVVRHGEEKLPEVLALGRTFRDEVEPFDLGEAVHQRTDLRPEGLVDLLERRRGVLDGVVQHGRRDGGLVELQLGENRRNLKRMAEEQVADARFWLPCAIMA